MDRTTASKLLRNELDKHGLSNWGVRLTTDPNKPFLGLCVYKDKVIILNAHYVDIHPDAEVISTILHEVAHALCPGQGHNDVWAAKAREIGCDNTLPCSHLNLPDHIIDAIRSGADIEMTVEEETQIIRRPKYTVTRLQDKCPVCGKVAKERKTVDTLDRDGNTLRIITLDCFHVIFKTIPRGTAFDSLVSNWWKPEVKSCAHDWNKTICNKCGEFRLMKFQVQSAHFVESALALQKGAGVFHDMGLGKTIIALSYVHFHSEHCPVLYITKSAIKFQWLKEIMRWLGPTHIPQVIETSRDYIVVGLKSYIISYDLLRRLPKEKIAQLGIKLVILDECQQIKNADSTRTQEVRKLIKDETVKVIPLSGTPWKNRGSEFFPVLNMLAPTKFYSYQNFLDRWVDYYFQGDKRKEGGIKNVPQFREYVKDIITRYEYNEVMDEFPDINRTKLVVQLDDLSQESYDESTSEFVDWYNQHVIDGTEDDISGLEILAQLARMRHITGLAKIPATEAFVEDFIEETDRKLVIFVHHKDVGQLLFESLKKKFGETILVLKYTSELADDERFRIQELFNKTPRAIMIASTLACGEGVNLQTCADAVMHERQWNPQNEDQAAPGRFRRIGQKASAINITFTEADGTVDQQLDEIVETKRRNFHNVMNKGEVPTWNQGEIAKQLAEMIVKKFKGKKTGTKSGNSITNMATIKR